MVKVLIKPGVDILREMDADDAYLNHMVLGIAGEAGELVDAIKRHTIYRKDLDMENVIEELGDIEFFLEGIRSKLGTTREQTIQSNIEKLSKRYPGFQYSNSNAQNRADKQ